MAIEQRCKGKGANYRLQIMYKFAAAWKNESIVFGAARPRYSNEQVQHWIEFMQHQGIQRVCCLLPEVQLARYSDLLGVYRKVFGVEHVCWAPVEDFQLIDLKTLTQIILPFLRLANQRGEKVVVHCSGGIGRTGQVLAAWLVSDRGLSNEAAITAVRQAGRNPYEAAIAALMRGQNPCKVVGEFNILLSDCHRTVRDSY